MHFVSHYYDITDAGQPVKKIYNDKVYIPLGENFSNEVVMNVVRNQYKVNSAILPFFEDDFSDFYSIEYSESYYQQRFSPPPGFDVPAKFRFESNYQVNVYETNISNLVDIFGLVGGIFELAHVFSGFLLGMITDRILRKDILNSGKEGNYNVEASEEWFSYPPEAIILTPEEKEVMLKRSKKKKNRNREVEIDPGPEDQEVKKPPKVKQRDSDEVPLHSLEEAKKIGNSVTNSRYENNLPKDEK